jgi:hypothetical protein
MTIEIVVDKRLLLLCHPRRLGFEKMPPDPRAVTKAPVRLQVAPVAFL